MVYFVKVLGLHIQLIYSDIQQKCFPRNLTKVLFAALKNKKSSHNNNERKSAFQTIAIELYK